VGCWVICVEALFYYVFWPFYGFSEPLFRCFFHYFSGAFFTTFLVPFSLLFWCLFHYFSGAFFGNFSVPFFATFMAIAASMCFMVPGTSYVFVAPIAPMSLSVPAL
jgi:hypothetical protein